MVDSIVGQANMIRAILGLPERELVEDTSQDEGIAFSVTEQWLQGHSQWYDYIALSSSLPVT